MFLAQNKGRINTKWQNYSFYHMFLGLWSEISQFHKLIYHTSTDFSLYKS